MWEGACSVPSNKRDEKCGASPGIQKRSVGASRLPRLSLQATFCILNLCALR